MSLSTFDMISLFDMLTESFSYFMDKVVNPLFKYYSIPQIAFGLFVIVTCYRFLLWPWLHGASFRSGDSNTAKHDGNDLNDYYYPSNSPRLETRGFEVK